MVFGSSLDACDPDNIAFNCTKNEYLQYVRGPQSLPLLTALLVTIFFVSIFVTGVIGNTLVCMVIVRDTLMHTATNFYLFNLAVSDTVFLVTGLPYEIALYWHQYPFNLGLPVCKIRALVSEGCSYVSVLTIVAFSLERFVAVCHPLHFCAVDGCKRAVTSIIVIWILSFASAMPFGLYTTIDYLQYPVDKSYIMESAFCAMLENPYGFPLWEISSCLFFLLPLALIVILYIRMGLTLHKLRRSCYRLGIRRETSHGSRYTRSRGSVIKMLAAVVVTFFLCWAPFHVQRIAFLYARNWEYFQEVNSYLFTIGGWFYYVSCTINPLLYNVMCSRYRLAFKKLLCSNRKTESLRRQSTQKSAVCTSLLPRPSSTTWV